MLKETLMERMNDGFNHERVKNLSKTVNERAKE
jgi:hypothetical protein